MTDVLHVRTIVGHGGGPEKTILRSPRRLAERGYSALCAYLHPPDDPGLVELERRAARAQAPIVSVPDRGPLDWRPLGTLARLCRAEKVAIWHAHDYKTNLLGLLLRRSWPMRLVTTVHGWTDRTGRAPLYHWLDRRLLAHYDRVICVTESLREECLGLGTPTERCHFVPNAIEAPADPPALRRRGTEGAGCRLGAVGRLSPEKGFDLLIRAADELLRRGWDVSLRIAGDGPARADLERLIGDLGRGDRIALVGHLGDPGELYRDVDAFVLSSRREGLPNVLLEAMAFALPCLATKVGGVGPMLRNGHDGLLAEPDSIPALVGGLERLLEDASLGARLGRAARETVLRTYSFERRMQRICEIYDALEGRAS